MCVVGYTVPSRFVEVHSMTFAQRRNCLTTHFSESVPVVKRRISVCVCVCVCLCVCIYVRIDVQLRGTTWEAM